MFGLQMGLISIVSIYILLQVAHIGVEWWVGRAVNISIPIHNYLAFCITLIIGVALDWYSAREKHLIVSDRGIEFINSTSQHFYHWDDINSVSLNGPFVTIHLARNLKINFRYLAAESRKFIQCEFNHQKCKE